MFSDLISTTELAKHLGDPAWAIVDCRFSMADRELGRQDYQAGHIPGALYAHLERDLSGPEIRGKTGRHPLPDIETLAAKFSAWGIGPGVQVVVYDAAGGALTAVRLWWMLRWLGHHAVAVLDGGWQAWQRESYPVKAGEEQREQRDFRPQPDPSLQVSSEEVERLRLDPAWRLADSRSHERYHGKNETIDAVAGHIPGAISVPYAENLTADGTFRSKEELRQRFEDMLAGAPAEQAVFYCGSGVTAIHNILAMRYAGLGEAKLYVGSWSEWIADPKRPIQT